MRLTALAVVFALACSSEESSPSRADAAGSGGASQDAGSDAPSEVGPGDGSAGDASADAASDAATFAPGDKKLLSVENPDHLDEDPSVLLAKDGSLHVAWFSHRGGNPDIYVKRTLDGANWTETRITTSPSADYFPSLLQDDTGRFHVTWFRWTAFKVGSIWYNSSVDGVTWDGETQVTTDANVDDWVPTLALAPNGDVLVTFASAKRNPAAQSQLYMARRPVGQSTWLPAVELTSLGSSTQDDTLPFIANVGTELGLCWVRCAPGGPDPCLVQSSNLFYATSIDGTTWSAPKQITNDTPDDVVDTLPSMFRDLSGKWSILWLSSKTGSVKATRLDLTSLDAYPAAAKTLDAFTGYSPHAAPTPTPGVLLGVWVEDTDPNDSNKKDVFYRFFAE